MITICSVPAQVQPCSTDRSSHTQCHFYTFAYPPSLFCSVPTQVQPCSISHTSCTQYHFYICLHSPPPCSALFPHRFSPVALVRPPTLAASTLQTSLLCSFIWRSKRGGQMPQLQALKRRRKGTAVWKKRQQQVEKKLYCCGVVTNSAGPLFFLTLFLLKIASYNLLLPAFFVVPVARCHVFFISCLCVHYTMIVSLRRAFT